MSGNICRCGAYVNIVAAIEQVLGAGETAQTRSAPSSSVIGGSVTR